jgi:hypothetical protein
MENYILIEEKCISNCKDDTYLIDNECVLICPIGSIEDDDTMSCE